VKRKNILWKTEKVQMYDLRRREGIKKQNENIPFLSKRKKKKESQDHLFNLPEKAQFYCP
jgi:hypothetical protein